MILFLGGLLGLCGSGKSQPSKPEVAEIYLGLREMVLTLTPEALGLGEGPSPTLLALLMETGTEGFTYTLVATEDGAASLYFSNGGAVIGGGEHAEVHSMSRQLLAEASARLNLAEATTEFPLPEPGQTRFYFVTPEGVKTVAVPEDDLGHNRHELSRLFHRAHELIYWIRTVEPTGPRSG